MTELRWESDSTPVIDAEALKAEVLHLHMASVKVVEFGYHTFLRFDWNLQILFRADLNNRRQCRFGHLQEEFSCLLHTCRPAEA